MVIERLVQRTSAAILIACVLTVALTAAQLWRVAEDESGATGYHVGEAVDVPSEWYEGRATTLFVFLRSDCVASQELVTRLAELRSQLPRSLKLFAVVSGFPAEVKFAETAGFDRSAIGTTELSSLRLRVVPGFVVVGRDGIVQLEQLAAGDQRLPDLLSALSNLVSAS